MGLLDYSNMCVEQQRWGSTESSFGDPISFRAPDLSARMLLSILPRVHDLERDSMHPIQMKNAWRAFDALCEHSILDDAGRPIDRFSEIGARITRNVKAPSAQCELCKLKAELKPKFDSAARRHALETCWFHYQAVRCPLILGLATQPGISYVFVREFLSVVDPDFVLPAAVPDSQLSVEPAVSKAVRALFTEQYHREYCERYDTHMEADPCSPYGALQWSVDPYNIRADIRAYCKEHNLLSRERKKDWLKLASDPNCKFQDLDDHDEGLPFIFIDLLCVDSVGNPKVEGNFNLDDLYGDTQLEGMRKEAQLMYVCSSLGPERAARRDPAMRVRGDAGKKLRKDTKSLPQLEQYGRDLMESFRGATVDDYNKAGKKAVAEADERKRAGRKSADWSEVCMYCDEGGALVLCEHCEHAAHLRCASLECEPDEWLCDSCINDD